MLCGFASQFDEKKMMGMTTMNNVITGHVVNNQIVLDDKVDTLPEGATVRITILSKRGIKKSGLCGIWEDERSPEEIVEDIVNSRSKGREVNL